MNNNYRYPYSFPEAEILPEDYRYATERFQMQLPLPGYSVKLGFQERPERFLTVNRKKREIDYLKSHIQRKIEMEQLHYQAKIEQMRKQNQLNRRKLELLLMQQPKDIFQIPEQYTEEARSLGQNLDRIPLRGLYEAKQRYLMDSIDRVKLHGGLKANRNSSVQDSGEDDELDTQEEEKAKMQRQRQLNYIYKKNGGAAPKTHFTPQNVVKKQIQEKKQKQEELLWVQKVRNALKSKYLHKTDSQEQTSSKQSKTSSEKKQKSQVPAIRAQSVFNRKSVEESQSDRNMPSQPLRRETYRNPLSQRQKPQEPAKRRALSRVEQASVSNLSDFSRQFQQQENRKQKEKNREKVVFQEEQDNYFSPITHKNNRKNWVP